MTSRLRIIKNSGYLLFARMFVRLASLPFFIYAATKLGPELFGILIFVTASVEILNSLSNLGIQRYGARAMVRDEMKSNHLAGILIFLRITFATILVSIALTAILLTGPASPKNEVMLLGLVAVLVSSFIQTTETLLTGVEHFGASATFQVIGRAVYVTGGFLAVYAGFSVVAVMLIYVISLVVEGLIRMIYTVNMVTTFSRRFSRSEFMQVLRGIMPFALTAIATLIYYRADALILDIIKGDVAVGIYGVAYSFYAFFVWIPIVLSRVLLPPLTERFKNNPKVGEASGWFWYRIVGILSMPAIFIATVLVGPFITFLMPESYAMAIPTLRILIWSVPAMMMVSVGFILLTAIDREMLGAHTTVITAVFIVIMDIILVSRYDVQGAAAAMVAATVFWGIQTHWLLARYLFSPQHGVIRTFGIMMVAGTAMGAAALATLPLGLPVVLAAGLAAYGAVAAGGWLLESRSKSLSYT